MLGALSPGQGRLDRRHADRAVSELTSGSSWHAAGGFHTLNGDPNVAKLQAYTVSLYEELESSPASPAACT
jgi:glycine/D-amino acid oxidase-like deaminating enzyme